MLCQGENNNESDWSILYGLVDIFNAAKKILLSKIYTEDYTAGSTNKQFF